MVHWVNEKATIMRATPAAKRIFISGCFGSGMYDVARFRLWQILRFVEVCVRKTAHFGVICGCNVKQQWWELPVYLNPNHS